MKKNIPTYYYIILLCVLASVAVIYCFTGLWPWKDNAYNSYSIQAAAWLDGHLDIGENREWLELAIYNGKYYVSFPPFPSYLLLPFATVYGEKTPDHLIALVITLVGVFYAVRLYEKTQKDTRSIILYSLFVYIASGILFIGINGYVWFLAQNLCITLSFMSIYYAISKKGGWSLTLWACAVGCRPMTIVYLPLLAVIIYKSSFQSIKEIKNKWYWCIGPVLLACSYMILNYKRFGSIFEFGHNYLPEFMRTSTGQFDLSYLLPNLKKLLALPGIDPDSGIVEFPNVEGFAFYIATPLFVVMALVFLYRLIAMIKGKKPEVFTDSKESSRYYFVILIMLPVLAISHVIFICLHKTLGGWGFGNRYLLDSIPWLYYGFLLFKPRSENFDRFMLPLFIWGMALNLTGTIATYNYWI